MEKKVMESKVLNITKKLALEFIIIIFIIGFFSKSFVNYSLPKVSTLMVFQGSYEKSIPIEGSIEYKEVFKVRLASAVVIDEYFVEPGKTVDLGGKVFKINGNYGIADEQLRMKELELQLEKHKTIKNKLQTDSLVDEKKLNLLKIKLRGEEEQLESLQEKFKEDSSYINEEKIQEQQQTIKLLKMDLEIEELILKSRHLETQIKTKEVENQILQVEKEIKDIKGQSQFYSKVEEDGIYYSEVKGMILKVNRTNSIISPKETVVEMAIIPDEIDHQGSFIFVGYLPEKYGHGLRYANAVNIRLTNIDDPMRVIIREIYYDESKEAFKFIGELTREIPSKVILTKNYNGVISITQTGEKIVPRSALVAQQLQEGSTGYVYIIETEEGVLGKSHTARAVEVGILSIGDHYVSVSGLEAYEGRRVITNVSHKIRDGVKVQYGN